MQTASHSTCTVWPVLTAASFFYDVCLQYEDAVSGTVDVSIKILSNSMQFRYEAVKQHIT